MNRGITSKGFTLIEMLVVLAIIAIVVTLSTPLSNIYKQNRVSTHVQEFVGALNVARSEAVSKGIPVSICIPVRTTNNNVVTTSCAPAINANTDWSNGWIVFSDVVGNGDCIFQPGNTPTSDTILNERSSLGGGFTFGLDNTNGNAPACITYTAAGVVTLASTGFWKLCDPAYGDNLNRTINVTLTGRAQILNPQLATAQGINLANCP